MHSYDDVANVILRGYIDSMLSPRMVAVLLQSIRQLPCGSQKCNLRWTQLPCLCLLVTMAPADHSRASWIDPLAPATLARAALVSKVPQRLLSAAQLRWVSLPQLWSSATVAQTRAVARGSMVLEVARHVFTVPAVVLRMVHWDPSWRLCARYPRPGTEPSPRHSPS